VSNTRTSKHAEAHHPPATDAKPSVISDENSDIAPQASPQPLEARIPFTSIAMPGFVARARQDLSELGQNVRGVILPQMPDFVLNNSTNIIGSIQLVAEGMAFKSTGANLISPEHRDNPLYYLIDPPRNVLKSLTATGKFDMSAADLLRPSFYKDTVLNYTNLEAATKFDLAHHPKLINRWQARSGFCGIAGMTVATLLPNAKDDPKETERMTALFNDSPLQYFGTRLGQAVYFPGWGTHKTQFAGLGMLGAGLCSFLSGFRNVSTIGNTQRYFFNSAHSFGGLVTAVAGAQLMFGVDNQQSWQNYGATQFLRLAILPQSIMKKYRKHDAGAHWYAGGASLFQAKNFVSFIIGGAERDADGNLIDKSARRQNIRHKVGADEKGAPFILQDQEDPQLLEQTDSPLLAGMPSPSVHSPIGGREPLHPEPVQKIAI